MISKRWYQTKAGASLTGKLKVNGDLEEFTVRLCISDITIVTTRRNLASISFQSAEKTPPPKASKPSPQSALRIQPYLWHNLTTSFSCLRHRQKLIQNDPGPRSTEFGGL
jgi:hypothetical protein